jgi:vacuolar-type H+-ATPase subunit F/Vma7
MTTHQVRVVCRPEVAAGFALAGVPVVEAKDAHQAQQLIEQLSERETTGVLLVQEDLLANSTHDADRGPRLLPMIVPFPGPEVVRGRDGAEAFISEILRQAIGYRVRLK